MKVKGAACLETGAVLIRASRLLARKADSLRFHEPVSFIYNPLRYARSNHEAYLETYARPYVRVLFLGMNPGPWGMAQTGVPFGEVEAVREWLGIHGKVGSNPRAHPRLPVKGLECGRSEVSGRRFWGLMRERYQKPGAFFERHFVANYCPLLFLDAEGRNVTPVGLSKPDRPALFEACDAFLFTAVKTLSPEWIIGIGKFAEQRIAAAALSWRGIAVKTAGIPHPSPASPMANRDWSGRVTGIMEGLGIW